MCNTLVFLETSLNPEEAKKIMPNAEYLPSIKKGDVLKAIKAGYQRLVIIDGHFSWTPAVWHKEILIALDYGIEVFGASSMGAIRAAELDAYGMKGIGTVYSMYKSGVIDADDEVAIAFSPYNQLQTVPLINIRVTLEHLTIKSKKSVFSSIKKIFYAERTWNKIAENLPEDVFDLIRLHYIDIKKEDALSLLNHVRALPNPPQRTSGKKNRTFTVFEKKLIESVFHPVILNQIEIKPKGNFEQLIRAKNLIKLLAVPKTRKNLLYYQSLIHLIDEQLYRISEMELMDQFNLFREEKNLLLAHEVKQWLIKRKLFHAHLEKIFIDYIKINKYLLIFYDYNNYL